MKKWKPVLKESNDVDELVGYLKSKYSNISDVKKDDEFKKLSSSDKEYIIDELKDEFTETKLKENTFVFDSYDDFYRWKKSFQGKVTDRVNIEIPNRHGNMIVYHSIIDALEAHEE